MNDALRILGSIAGGAAGGLTIAGFLSKRLVDQALARDLESLKAELGARADGLKAELSIYAHEQNVALSRVDVQRSEAIKSVYSAFRRWTIPTTNLIVGNWLMNADEHEQMRHVMGIAEDAHEAGVALSGALADNAIFLDTATYSRLAIVVGKAVRATAQFLRPIREADAMGLGWHEVEEAVAANQLELRRLHDEDLDPLLRSMITEFRRLLGIDADTLRTHPARK